MNRQPLVLIHGFPLDHRLWAGREGLADGRAALAPDLPGFGGQPAPPRPGSVAAYADFVLSQADRAGLDRAVFCGLSMGGYVVFELWRRVPGRFAGVVLCDTRAEADLPEARRARDAAIVLVKAGRRAEFLEGFTPRLLGTASARDPQVQGLVESMGRDASDEGVCAALEALRDRPDSRPLLPDLRVPALIVVGDEDAVTPPDTAASMHRAIPGSRLVVIPGAGHLVPLEQPAAFGRAVAGFLKDAGL